MPEFVDEALAILGDLGQNRRYLPELEPLRQQIVPFVGAGLSIPFGYPAWGDLLLQLAPDDEIRKEVEADLQYFRYEEAADRIQDELSPKAFRIKLQELLKDRDFSDGAVLALPGIAPDLVITTNLDGILERVFEFQSIFHGADLHDVSGAIQRRERVLLKLHGSTGRDETWVFTLKQYRAVYGEHETGLEKPLHKILRQAITGRVLLFLGCSLQADRTMRVVEDVVKDLGVWHYAVLPVSENTGPRLDQFRRFKIKPLFFPNGQYERIEKFLICLAAQQSGAPLHENMEALVARARARLAPFIRVRCSTMKILDMEQPIELAAIYTDVNILEKRASGDKVSIEDLQRLTAVESFERFVQPDKRERVPGFDAVHKYERLAIYGKPGAGKTTFLKCLALECMESRFLPDLAPVFVTLLDFASQESHSSLEGYIAGLIPGIDAASILAEGRMLVLLDGLDEVPDAQFSRVRHQIGQLTDRYPSTPVVMTCRIAAREYNFDKFVDVEMADFGPSQVETFTRKWFAAKSKSTRSERFLQRLKENKRLAELASNPLLLTLLCLIFEETGDFGGSRAGLYQEGIDTLMKKWDATRDIERKTEVPVEHLRMFLEELAYYRFSKGEYFFAQQSLEPDVQTFLKSRSIGASGGRVLAICESNLGLLAQRARKIYSFSHLPFQEFLTARRLQSDPGLLSAAAQNLGDRRWNEVWLLLTNLMDPEYLLPTLKHYIDRGLSGDSRLQEWLEWLQRKSREPRSVTKSAVRAFYADRALALDLDLDLALALAREIAITEDLDLDRALAIARALDLALDLDLDRALALSRALTRDLDFDLALDFALDLDRALDRALDRVLAGEGAHSIAPALAQALKQLGDSKPDWRDKSAAQEWTEQLRSVMIQHRDIGHDWNFSKDQQQKLNRYLQANRLLIQCMDEAPTLTTATRERLKDQMLLPYATLYPRAQAAG